VLDAYFMLSGRIRRWRFFLCSLVLWITAPVLALLGIPLVENARYPEAAAIMVVVVIGMFWTWAGMALVMKRLHDLNRSGWHYVWMFFLPGLLTGSVSLHWNNTHGSWSFGYGQVFGIVAVLASLYLIFAPGSDGPNDYGYPP